MCFAVTFTVLRLSHVDNRLTSTLACSDLTMDELNAISKGCQHALLVITACSFDCLRVFWQFATELYCIVTSFSLQDHKQAKSEDIDTRKFVVYLL
jgi:hypothetical protein